jgi:hypothetical protein
MSERKIGFDRANLEGKISEDGEYLIAEAVIASEIVHEYPDGWAYKSADELEKTAWTAEGRWVTILKHPDTALLQRASDIYGRVESPKFVKNLLDAKTQRPCRRGIKAKIKWDKSKLPQDVADKIRNGELRDVSIGFTYEEDRSSGEWEGAKYDYKQCNIFIDHLAAPIEKGRCPGPICGIGVDSVVKHAVDPEENEETVRIPAGNECKVTATITISEKEGIQALYCGKEKQVRTYLFDKSKGWTMDKAKAWVESHKGDSAADLVAKSSCDICQEIEKIGVLEASKRLKQKFGEAVVYVLKGEEQPKPKMPPKLKDDSLEVLLVESKKARDSLRWLFEPNK